MSFEWSDDSKVTYTKWAKNEPNNWNGQTREDCVIMLLKVRYIEFIWMEHSYICICSEQMHSLQCIL